jgi:DNA-directed RNA polymerase III subunit RPC3
MAARYLGDTTSKVYEALLCVAETDNMRCDNPIDPIAKPPQRSKKPKKSKMDDEDYEEALEQFRSLYEDEDVPLCKIHEVDMLLDPELDLSNGLYGEELTPAINGHGGDGSDAGKENKDELQPDRKWKPVTPALRLHKIEQHLRLLAVDRRQFVQLVGRDYRVPFNALTRTLINNTIEDFVTARHGTLSAWAIRMLSATGNLDEGQLVERSMVTAKDIRLAITSLCQAGYLKMQEVPKDTTRQIAKIAWTVKYDVRQARRQLLNDTYQAMARLLARLEVERVKVEMVIEKSERSDVVGNEDKYLSAMEKHKLQRWNEVEEMLLRQVHRMDELVATMRDFIRMEGVVLPV